ncbi:MAG TPA: hypothetical protein PLU75_06020 [Oscillospiraceae bacterium]|nr:hypothetical protein [Oscillospiraceae bacterium]HRW57804.1 hypothetical protein [Oscillospiraceae bacterium]
MKPDQNDKLLALIAANSTLYHIKADNLPIKIGISRSTYNRRLKKPETFTAIELRRLGEILHWSNEEKSSFI